MPKKEYHIFCDHQVFGMPWHVRERTCHAIFPSLDEKQQTALCIQLRKSLTHVVLALKITFENAKENPFILRQIVFKTCTQRKKISALEVD